MSRQFSRLAVLGFALMAFACSGATDRRAPGPPASIVLRTTMPGQIPAGALLDTLVVQVTDESGRPVPNSTVKWVARPGVVVPAQSLTDLRGKALAAWDLSTRAGFQSLTVSTLVSTGSLSLDVNVQVISGAPESLILSPAPLELREGMRRRMHARAYDAYGNPVSNVRPAWSSSDTTIARVDSTGQVAAVSAGVGEIVVELNGATARAVVRVVAPLPGDRSALWFDGVGDLVDVPDDDLLDFGRGDFTGEILLTRSRIGVREDVLSKKDLHADSEHDLVLVIETDGRPVAFLRDYPHGSTVLVSGRSRIGRAPTHIALTRSAGTVRIYVDGVLEGSGHAPIDVTSTGPLRIGANRLNDGPGDAAPVFAFSGQVEEVRMWSRARTAEEIAKAAQECVAPGSPGLVAFYRFSEGSGSVLRDASGNGLHGTLRGAPAWVPAPPRCPG